MPLQPSTGTLMTPETPYFIASVTKMLVLLPALVFILLLLALTDAEGPV